MCKLTTQETIIYLLDEALDLWGAILTQTPAPASPEILSLLPALYPIFEAATDSVPQALQIAESYIYLAPQEVLSDGVRFHLLASFEALLKSTTRQRLGIVPRLVELMIRGADISTPPPTKEATYNTIARSLVDSSFLASLLEGLHSAHEASQTTGPNRKQTSVYGVVETDYFSVLARLALASPPILVSALSATTNIAPDHSPTPNDPLPWLLSEWFLHYDNIGSVTQKKLHALALTNLLTLLPDPSTYYTSLLLSNLQSYLSVWTNIITELADDSNTDPASKQDYLVNWSTHETQSPETEPPETTRRRDWDNADPLHSIDMQAFVRERLQALIAACGGESRFQEEWLVNVDRDVVGGFAGLGLF